jgi:hypothetical protein
MSSWAEVEFSTVDLGDVRRSERLKKVVERMWQAPGASQRGAAEDWAGARPSKSRQIYPIKRSPLFD